MQAERVGFPDFHATIKLARLSSSTAERLAALFCTEVQVLKIEPILLGCLVTDHQVDKAAWVECLRVPLLEQSLCRLELLMVNVDLGSEAAELSEPRLAHAITGHGCVEGILAQLGVLLLVAESANRALNREDEVLLLVALESEATAGLTIPLEFDNGVF